MGENPLTIEFVNNKSAERVSALVNELEKSFKSAKPTFVEKKASTVLERIDKEPLFGISESKLFKYPMNGEETPKYNSPFKSLQQYSFSCPPTIPKEIAGKENDDIFLQKKQFLIEARQEHHRLLWAFQDRLAFDTFSQDGSGYKSPFTTAAKLLAKEANNPYPEAEQKAEAKQSQGKAALILRKSQAASSEVLDKQIKVAKMLQDREYFRAVNTTDGIENQKINEIHITFPYSILCDNESSK